MKRLFEKPIGERPAILQMKIVCGDCMGDDLLPKNTNLTTDGRCAECGGRSFEFASLIGARLAQHLRNLRTTNTQKENDHVKQNNTTYRAATSTTGGIEDKLRLVG